MEKKSIVKEPEYLKWGLIYIAITALLAPIPCANLFCWWTGIAAIEQLVIAFKGK